MAQSDCKTGSPRMTSLERKQCINTVAAWSSDHRFSLNSNSDTHFKGHAIPTWFSFISSVQQISYSFYCIFLKQGQKVFAPIY
jgi:hypothetical protein